MKLHTLTHTLSSNALETREKYTVQSVFLFVFQYVESYMFRTLLEPTSGVLMLTQNRVLSRLVKLMVVQSIISCGIRSHSCRTNFFRSS